MSWTFGGATTLGGVLGALLGGPWWALGSIMAAGFVDGFLHDEAREVLDWAAAKIKSDPVLRARIKADPALYQKWLAKYPCEPLEDT